MDIGFKCRGTFWNHILIGKSVLKPYFKHSIPLFKIVVFFLFLLIDRFLLWTSLNGFVLLLLSRFFFFNVSPTKKCICCCCCVGISAQLWWDGEMFRFWVNLSQSLVEKEGRQGEKWAPTDFFPPLDLLIFKRMLPVGGYKYCPSSFGCSKLCGVLLTQAYQTPTGVRCSRNMLCLPCSFDNMCLCY